MQRSCIADITCAVCCFLKSQRYLLSKLNGGLWGQAKSGCTLAGKKTGATGRKIKLKLHWLLDCKWRQSSRIIRWKKKYQKSIHQIKARDWYDLKSTGFLEKTNSSNSNGPTGCWPQTLLFSILETLCAVRLPCLRQLYALEIIEQLSVCARRGLCNPIIWQNVDDKWPPKPGNTPCLASV